ncbi:hypothetical protein HN51_009023 [Arachis hypogaea]
MSFVYVLSRFEGSVSNSRIPGDAITRQLYRGTRYHVREWVQRAHTPHNYQEYFNKKHSFAKNIIKKCFGLLNNR